MGKPHDRSLFEEARIHPDGWFRFILCDGSLLIVRNWTIETSNVSEGKAFFKVIDVEKSPKRRYVEGDVMTITDASLPIRFEYLYDDTFA